MLRQFYILAATAALAGCEPPTAPLSPEPLAPEPLAEYATIMPEDAGYVAEDPRLQALVGRPAPALTLATADDGGTIDLATLYGHKPVYLKMWATYCIPCRRQMPAFEQLTQAVGDRITVIAVNAGFGDDADKVRGFARQYGLTMPQAIDDGRLGNWLGLDATPLHILIGMDGRIHYAGHQDGPALDAAVHALLNAPAPSEGVAAPVVPVVQPLQPGDLVPSLRLQGPHDVPMTLAGVHGTPQAILFTASWCESYLAEIEPQTVADCRRFREAVAETQASIAWLGVLSHLWTAPSDLDQFVAETPLTIPFGLDTEGRAFTRFGVRRIPAIALLDGEGRLVRVLGPDEAEPAEVIRTFAAAPSGS